MPDTPEEEEIKPPAELPPGEPEAGIIVPVAPEISTTQETKKMEVHHHSHAAHGKKTWKNYFWDFLMLFLAVFCGFLAEYQLEHLIEHQREKTFMRSMVDDLRDDHGKLDNYMADLTLGVRRMDSLITILNDRELVKQQGSQLYYLGRVSSRTNIFSNNTRTFDQLKNSGSFRLIRNDEASDRIMAYYGDIQFIRQLEDLYMKEFDEYKRIASTIFEPSVFRMMEQKDGEISREAGNPALRTNDPEKLKQLAVYAVYMNGSRRSILPAALALQKKGDELLAYLAQEYEIK